MTDAPDLAPTATARAVADPRDVAAIRAALEAARRPLIVAGGSGWSQQAADDLRAFAEASTLPVAVTFRRQDYMDNRSPSYAGDLAVGMNPALARRLAEADCLLILGSRFGDIPTGGYEIMDPAAPGKTLVHVHPDPDLPGAVFRADLAIAAPAPAVIAALNAGGSVTGDWRDWTGTARAQYEAWTTPRPSPGAVRMEAVVRHLSGTLPENAIVTNGAGNYAAWLHRYFTFKRFGTQLAPTSGSMGYGLPAAIAAKLEHPDRTVVCFAGDGCFQMTGNEVSTAVQHGANIVVIVANNGRYGTIRMHQEKTYPARVSGTDLVNPDFAALARAHGGHGATVTRQEDFAGAFDAAVAAGRPAIIELRLDPEALSTGMTLSEARAAGRARS
jgi:acetolactate synthase-1/2/3 large subunit